MTNSLPMKTRAMMYEQQLDHLPRLVDEMYRRIETLAPKRYAGIVHDSDTTDAGRPAAAHLHVMMEFQNPRSLNSIAKLLGDKPERIEAWKAGVENGFFLPVPQNGWRTIQASVRPQNRALQFRLPSATCFY